MADAASGCEAICWAYHDNANFVAAIDVNFALLGAASPLSVQTTADNTHISCESKSFLGPSSTAFEPHCQGQTQQPNLLLAQVSHLLPQSCEISIALSAPI